MPIYIERRDIWPNNVVGVAWRSNECPHMSNVREYGGSNCMGGRTSTHIRWMSGVRSNDAVGVAGEVERVPTYVERWEVERAPSTLDVRHTIK